MPTRTVLRDPFTAQLSDDELVEQARRVGNDDGAYEELYRRHENAARNVARHILRSRQDADDVVNEAFAGVISAITNGAGPRTNFRQYLMACVRNSCKSRRWNGNSISTDPSILEQNGVCFEDPDRLSEQGLIASAFSSLSPDWQLTLWLTAVEERPTSEVAEQLGRRPGAVAALAHRAREAFAEAYLAQHQTRNTSPACAKITPKLAHYVRGHSGDVDTVLVERHLSNCVPCSCAVDELRDLNASLRTLTGPAPLLGTGLATAGTGVAMLAGFAPMVTAGGWSLGAIGGVTLAKAAVIGALLVPAAAIVSGDRSPSPTARAAGAVSAPVSTVRAVASPSVTAEPVAAAGSIGSQPFDGVRPGASAPADQLFAQSEGSTPGSLLTTVGGGDPLADTPMASVVPIVDTVTSVMGSTGAPMAVAVPLPYGSNAGVDLVVGSSSTAVTVPLLDGGAVVVLGTGSTGAYVAVTGTVPVVPVSLAVGVSIPPGVAAPTVSVGPLVTPPITIAAIPTLPVVGVPIVVASVMLPATTIAAPVVLAPPASADVPPASSTVVSGVVTPILQVLLGNH